MSSKKSKLDPTVAAALLGLVSVTMLAATALAADETDAAELTEVQVTATASRIQRSGFEAPTPTTIVAAEEIEARAAPRISQLLFDIPAMRPTATAVPFGASAGGTYANLRNLNPGAPTQTATRTLVLVDGRRVVANTATGLVDLNSIPTSLIERVEVVTGGASAAWGSDAVAGVTNFLLKKKIDGLEGSVQYGLSQRSDQKDANLNLAWGTDYGGGRGQFMIAGELNKVTDVPTVGSRPWGDDQWGWVSGTLNGITVNRIATTGVVAAGVTYGGIIVAGNGAALPTTGPSSALRGTQFGPNGVPQPFTYGTFLTTNQMVGGSGISQSFVAKIGSPVTRKNLYARTTYEFTDTVQGFVEAVYAHSDSIVDTQPMYMPNGDPVLTIQRDNAFLPASIRATMITNALTNFGLGRINTEFGAYSRNASGTDVRRYAAGLDGKLGADWTWKLFVGSGKTHYYDSDINNVNEPNLRAAVDTVVGPGGAAICRINSTVAADIAIVSAANYQGRGASASCVPANPFGPGSISPAAVAYIIGTSHAVADFKQDSAGGSIQGEPFSTWADKVSVAGGFDYRKESVSQVADPAAQQTSPAFQTGAWQFGNRRPLNGEYSVKELFGETIVPLVKDKPGFRTLDLNAAVRRTDYSTSGAVTSWKLGLSYKPLDGLLIRGTKSRDIRAANLVELFTPGTAIVGAIVDYGRAGNPSVSVPTTTIGNPGLKPESADTTTAGITWQPVGSGFRASVDWYQIKIEDAISSLGGQNIVSACYGRAPFTAPVPTACSLIARDSVSNVISNVTNSNLNLAFTNVSGIDFELAYQLELARVLSRAKGSLALRLLGTHLISQEENNGIVTVDRAGQLGNSRWRYSGSATYTSGPVAVFLQARYLQAALIDVTYKPADISDNNVPARVYLNGSVQYTLANSSFGKLQGFLAVNNLLDQDPPIVPSASAGQGQISLSPDYDKIGRYFTVGMRFKF